MQLKGCPDGRNQCKNMKCKPCSSKKSARSARTERRSQTWEEEGFCLLDTTVMRVMERWLYATLLAARKSDALHVMEYVCDKCVAIRERKIGLRHPDTTNSRRILGVIQKAQADAGFRQMLVEKGWVAYEQEELQNTERAKRLEEERMRKQEADLLRHCWNQNPAMPKVY